MNEQIDLFSYSMPRFKIDMVLLRASFHVAMGMCAVVMILMLVIMIAYIIKVCIEEIRK